jgi:enoyl-CoA hydratase/carnithine racemase
MGFEHIPVERSGDFATVTMNRPQRRNALSLQRVGELITPIWATGNGDALMIVLAAKARCSAPGTTSPTSPVSTNRSARAFE